MADSDFGGISRSRTPVTSGQWNAITLPIGGKKFLLSMELETSTWRFTPNNADPIAAGHYIAASSFVTFDGPTTAAITVYVNPATTTTAMLTWETELSA